MPTRCRAWPASPRRAPAVAARQACPVHAIEVDDGEINILDSCRKCGLCVPVCPTEAFVSPRLAPKKLYDAIAAAAAAHNTAYVTCTRALKRLPRENEVVIACVGDVTAETWFSIMADYPNVSVYLPLGICDKCRNTGGEDMMGEAIATAEEWAGTGMGLEGGRLRAQVREAPRVRAQGVHRQHQAHHGARGLQVQPGCGSRRHGEPAPEGAHEPYHGASSARSPRRRAPRRRSAAAFSRRDANSCSRRCRRIPSSRRTSA